MWAAYATQNNRVIYDWEINEIENSALRNAFQQANRELFGQTGCTSNEMLQLGWIAYSETREPLEIATGHQCFDNSCDGIMYWSAENVARISKTADWKFVHGENDDKFDQTGYWAARLFWQVCVEHGLGVKFTF